ncbi:MAG: hypothetical protein GY737_13520 [Desulfobacteraceae bacterium]|nr:hypothetical protein [Desulfobacteraceae bacterium]
MADPAEGYRVTVFSLFDFYPGQKIHIDGGPRKGDWEVVNLTERKVKLRCPVSLREFEWDRFCYHVAEQEVKAWPQED